MTNSVQAAAIPFLSGRNRIINGDMRVAQRTGTQTFTTSAAGYGQCDRWRFNNGTSGGTFTLAQNNTLTDENGVVASFNVLTATVAATSISGSTYIGGHQQLIEGFNCADLLGKPTTISFTVRASVVGTYALTMRTGVGDYSCIQLFNVPVANTPYRIVIPFPTIPSGANIPLSSAQGLQISIGALNTGSLQAPSAGSWQAGNYISAPGLTNWAATINATLSITNVQLEGGTVATPFERRSFAQELLFCQRYYAQTDNFGQLGGASRDSTSMFVWTGPTADSNSYLGVNWDFPATMRVGPTVTIYNPHTGATGTAYAQNAATSLSAQVAGLSATGCTLTLNNQSVIARDFIKFHASANAEL